MILVAALAKISKARLKDAKVLFDAGRYDGSAYVCGYAVEVALKARICRTLKWASFPSTNGDFQGLSSLKVHNLDILLRLTGREEKIKTTLLAEWSVVNQWGPDSRYKEIGTTAEAEARDMIGATEALLKKL